VNPGGFQPGVSPGGEHDVVEVVFDDVVGGRLALHEHLDVVELANLLGTPVRVNLLSGVVATIFMLVARQVTGSSGYLRALGVERRDDETLGVPGDELISPTRGKAAAHLEG
jgi:hypothetical protein